MNSPLSSFVKSHLRPKKSQVLNYPLYLSRLTGGTLVARDARHPLSLSGFLHVPAS